MFTPAEKAKTMIFLGHSPNLIDPDSADYNPRINGKFNVSEFVETEARSLLTKIEALEAKEDASMSHAGVRRVDDIEFFENGGTTTQLKKRRMDLIKRLSTLFDIVCYASGGSMINVGIL